MIMLSTASKTPQERESRLDDLSDNKVVGGVLRKLASKQGGVLINGEFSNLTQSLSKIWLLKSA